MWSGVHRTGHSQDCNPLFLLLIVFSMRTLVLCWSVIEEQKAMLMMMMIAIRITIRHSEYAVQ